MASSGLRSIAQKINSPPFNIVKIEASQEISGGDVNATTTSCRGNLNMRSPDVNKKLPKFMVRANRRFFPKLNDETRMMSI